jgi:F0F1-type ATP synthase assembly protein I
MKPATWYPNEKDAKVNQYLDNMNHAPYGLIVLSMIGLFCLLTFVILVGIF